MIYQAGSDSGRDFQAHHYDLDPTHGAKLVITYTTSVPPAEAFVSRVATPGSGSTFSSWTSLDDEISPLGGIALAVDSDTVYAFMVDDDLTTIVVRTSTDNGATWSARATVTAAGLTKSHLAAAAAGDDDLVLFYAEVDGTVYAIRWNGSAWGSPAAWTNAVIEVTGLATVYLLDWQVIVTGRLADSTRAVWSCRFGDGVNQTINTWGALKVITDAAATAGFSFKAPSVDLSSSFRVFFVEVFSGDAAYNRVQWSTLDLSHDFNEEQWLEPVTFDFEDAEGVAVVMDATTLWLVSAAGVWLSALPAFAEVDVSADVVKADVRIDQEGGVVELELDNADGSYTAYGAGSLGALQRGARLQLTPGYRTSAGAEVPTPYSYWVEAIELVTGARPRLRIRARDGWVLLANWRARRQFAWAAGEKSISQLLLFLTGRVGLEYSTVGTSTALTSLQPAFTIHPGESGLTAARRLFDLVEDLPYFDRDDLKSAHTADSDASTYALGGTHDILGAVYRDVGPSASRARVVGADVYGDESDFDEVERFERVRTVIDLNLTTSATATDRANAELRKVDIEARDDEVELFGVHCGVETYDVVDLTDAQAGLTAAKRRVLGYAWSFDPRRGRYGMTLTLGKV